jgi:nucleoid-associated protein YgaU
MRKDVKFGMTIGAILVATLVVYIIVLYRGGAVPSSNHSDKVAIVSPTGESDGGQQPGDANGTGAPTRVDSGASAAPDEGSSTAVTPPVAADGGAATAGPATQPTASSTTADAWDSALNHGVVKMFAADGPQHTVTPTIDRTDGATVRNDMVVAQDGHAALMDSAAATQPSAGIVALPIGGARGQRTHVVASGENLWTISAAVYGNSKYWNRILAANPGLNPKTLRVGRTLNIPELNDSERAQPADSGFAAVASDPTTTYKVVSGDSLERIAIRLYGSPEMKDNLYDANKSLIGADENRLKVGWVLKLPQPPTVAATAAR